MPTEQMVCSMHAGTEPFIARLPNFMEGAAPNGIKVEQVKFSVSAKCAAQNIARHLVTSCPSSNVRTGLDFECSEMLILKGGEHK